MWNKIQKQLLFAITHCQWFLRKSAWRSIALLNSSAARPLRFICIGAIVALIQLSMLDLLIYQRWNPVLANIMAFVLAAQVNFLLSTLFTWRDRRLERARIKAFFMRWAAFHVSISGTAVLNFTVFLAARTIVPTLIASALGIMLAAVLNFAVLDRFVFL
ncbi:MAG: GtrA family protein [Chloroflexi bacterium]|nr:GtrA family protein [Chloroflexota bacterium]